MSFTDNFGNPKGLSIIMMILKLTGRKKFHV